MPVEPLERFNFTYRDIGVGLLESITIGLYREAGDVLREYVSNEIDNDPAPKSVDVRVDPGADFVEITGDGPGMTWDEFRNAVKVGISLKEPTTHVGFRGIGIWAGVAACNELIVYTKSDQDPKEYELHINCEKLRSYFTGPGRNAPLIDALNECAGWQARKSSRFHGTQVILRGILPAFQKLLDEKEVREYLTKECPVNFEEGFRHIKEVDQFLESKLGKVYRRVRITLSGTAVRGLHIQGDVREPITGTIAVPLLGDSKRKVILGYFWLCHAKKTEKVPDGFDSGLRVRVKNFTVVPPITLQGHIKDRLPSRKTGNIHIFEYWVGEVHASHPDIKPNAERNDLEPALASDQLMEYVALELFDKLMVPLSKAISDYLRLGDETTKALAESPSPKDKEFLDDLSASLAMRQVDARIKDLELRKGRLVEKLKSLKGLEDEEKARDVEKIVREIEATLGPKTRTNRAIARLKQRRSKIDAIFRKKRSALGRRKQTSEPKESDDQTRGEPGESEDASSGEGASVAARTALLNELMPAINNAARRVTTFEIQPTALVEAFLVALVESGSCSTADDIERVVDIVIRVSQRRR